MKHTVRSMALALALLVTASCATTAQREGEAAPAAPNPQIAALDRAIEKEKDALVIPVLLFKRGHAYLEAAESVSGSRGTGGATSPGSWEFARLLLGAMRDFEDIANNFPKSAEAPEALFHLGVVYDYPNLMSFEIALTYYKRTLERYPDSDSARKARIAIDKIEAAQRDLGEGRHGAQ